VSATPLDQRIPLLSPSSCRGVGQPFSDEPEALPDVRGVDARSAQIGGPDGISQRFQVKAYSVEPRPSVSTRNLFSKDR
jgi:hypothetical protein